MHTHTHTFGFGATRGGGCFVNFFTFLLTTAAQVLCTKEGQFPHRPLQCLNRC